MNQELTELVQSIPNFKTYRVWNATRKCWVSKRYTRKGDAISRFVGPNQTCRPDTYIVICTSFGEVTYEKI